MFREHLPIGEVALRLAIATAAGALIGLNRWLRRKAAGLCTHAMVALSAALATLVAVVAPGADAQAVSRVIQGIVAGVGFIGAGVILHLNRENKIQGLTTAASIWTAAVFGIASAAADFRVVTLGVSFALIVLVLGKHFERLMNRVIRHRPERKRRPRPDAPDRS
ncbi:MAG: MgtC/SapB family protein [Acidobacteria bacterium]|nr:MgtC/SapB family protein [Acidobacteriota bacterium]